MAFRGTFDHSLDAKNRLTVPAKFRGDFPKGVVLSQGIEKCVQLRTPEAFETYVATALDGVPPLSERFRQMNRYFSANSSDTELDGAGRVGVPPFLLEYAGITKECKVIGGGDCLEVWDRKTWHDYNGKLAAQVGDISALFGS